MTDKQKATQENQRVPFDLSPCMAMMEQMMGQQEEGCACAEMMCQMMGQGGYAELMSQMRASCCGVQCETEETPSTDSTQEA
jgi:hypothetical protein